MLRSFADDINAPAPFEHFAFGANFFYRSSDFHKILKTFDDSALAAIRVKFHRDLVSN